jgi:biotin synthase-related radical SAM superfamily protein
MQANQRKTMEIARTELNQILTELAKKEVENILKTINNKLGNGQRQMYASMDPLDIINDLIEICRELCQSKQLELKFSFNE